MREGALFRFREAEGKIPGAAGEHAVSMLRHGTLNLLLALGKFAPHRPSTEPSVHEQDELYVVVRGSGVLVHGEKRDGFAAGDVMMVPAGTVHNFESMSDELAVWAIFYGQKGGEAPG